MARNRRSGARERGSSRAGRSVSSRGRARGRIVEPARPGSDWRTYRPAIWMVMIAIAMALLVTPVYLCALPLGAAIGIAAKIQRGRRRIR